MNLEKLRKATELMREVLAELDPSTGNQGASGGCGADESQTVLRSPFANGEYMIAGVNHCPGSDKWNCRQVATCEENRRIMAAPPVRIEVGREDWERVEELLRTGRPIPPGMALWLNTTTESGEASLARHRREHDLALGRVESFHWDCGEMATTLVPYPPRANAIAELYGRGEEEHFVAVLDQVGAELRGRRDRFGWGRASQSAGSGEKTAR